MFRNIKNADGAVAPFEYYPCSAITPKNGMAMALSGGKLTIASGTTKPGYICIEEHDAPVTAGDNVAVIHVDSGTIFETELTADGAALKLGNKVTISADGMGVTATTDNGVAEIVNIEDTGIGGTVHVRF